MHVLIGKIKVLKNKNKTKVKYANKYFQENKIENQMHFGFNSLQFSALQSNSLQFVKIIFSRCLFFKYKHFYIKK